MGLLEGKVAVVTGAGSGLGRSHALALAREGAKVVVNDLGCSRDGTGRTQAAANQVVEEIRALGGEAAPDYHDVSTMEGAAAIIQTALDRFGRIDILVNNAGILRDRTILKMEEEEWDRVIAVHLKGTFSCTQAAARAMKQLGRGGRIVNTTSLAGLKGNFGQANYGAAKAGIYGLTRIAALELAREGITVNAIAPLAKTRMTEDVPAIPEEMRPEQASPLVLFLTSDLAREVTGRVFGIHGQQIFEYQMITSPGATKASGLWTPQEIHERLAEIAEAAQPAARPGEEKGKEEARGPADLAGRIERIFEHLPQVFSPGKAPGWHATLHFEIAGARDLTLSIEGDQSRFSPGRAGTPSCTIQVDAETLAGMIEGKVDGTKAFLAGKIKTDNLADLVKFRQAFNLKRAKELAEGEAFRYPAGDASSPQRGAQGHAFAGDFRTAPGSERAAPAAAPTLVKAEQQARLRALFENLPKAFRAEKAGGWNGTFCLEVDGVESCTLAIRNKELSLSPGRTETPTCTIRADIETLIELMEGRLDAQQLFSAGKLKADNLSGLIKFRHIFEFKPGLLAPEEKPPEPMGLNRGCLGKKYRSRAVFARPPEMKEYALATNDPNPHYLDEEQPGGIIAPPLYAVVLFKELMMRVLGDEELRANLALLVHGAQDMRFHAPIRPWDLLAPRSVIIAIEEKPKGQLLTLNQWLYREGVPVVEASMGLFFRRETGARAEGKGEGAPAEAAIVRPEPAFSAQMLVTPDQPLRYARASGDVNPIHTDPELARAAGFPGIILQGLCTMALVGKAVVDEYLIGDPIRLKRLSVRFARPVLPGDVLTTQGWLERENDGQFVLSLETRNQKGEKVIVDGLAEVEKESS
ncbi:MAG: SDR family NAD(P)-dependent oxidoreductase [Nitrospinae bacterium]|nr:SDR family NAD(P)-dependent oxidoreductase [Nitrospinota bacterium]